MLFKQWIYIVNFDLKVTHFLHYFELDFSSNNFKVFFVLIVSFFFIQLINYYFRSCEEKTRAFRKLVIEYCKISVKKTRLKIKNTDFSSFFFKDRLILERLWVTKQIGTSLGPFQSCWILFSMFREFHNFHDIYKKARDSDKVFHLLLLFDLLWWI